MMALTPVSTHSVRLLAYLLVTTLYVYRVVRRNRRDRVLLCEAIGVSVFFIALLLSVFLGLPDWLLFMSGFAAVLFGVLAVYSALLNWAERRVKRAKAK
jgi:hypothetical protein